MKLTDSKISKLKPGRHNDAIPTLQLVIKPSGGKSWIQRIVIDGKRRDIGLGSYPATTIDEAREEAIANRKAIKQQKRQQRRAALVGIEQPTTTPAPIAEPAKQNPTFQEIALECLEALSFGWKESTREKVKQNWKTDFNKRIFPVIGNTQIDCIQKADILKILTPIWTTRNHMAQKTRMRIKQVFKRAISFGYCEQNPAGEVIDGALPQIRNSKGNYKALPHSEIKQTLEAIKTSDSSNAVKLSLELLILTACRSNEIRGMLWKEIDGDTWTIPANRMKGGKTHRVSLSQSAQEIIESAKALNPSKKGLVFPSEKNGKELSATAHSFLLKAIGLADKATIHGFRSSFRDWCADTGKSRELAEAALAHTVQGVEGAYLRSDRLEPRRQLMEQWAQYVTGTTAKVVQLHG